MCLQSHHPPIALSQPRAIFTSSSNLCVSSPVTRQSPSPSLRPSSCHHWNPHVSSPAASQSLIHTSTLKSSQHHPVSTPVSASWLGLDAYMEATTTDVLPTPTGPVPVHRSRNEDEGDDEDQEQSDHSDQYHASDTGDENLNGLEDSSEQYSEDIDELKSKGEDTSKDGGERVDRCRPKKHKVSGMKHGAKGKASIPKDEDEDTDKDDIEETFERLN